MILIKILLLLLAFKIFGYFILQIVRRRKAVTCNDNKTGFLTTVNIIVPMFNEERIILKTIENLLQIDYCNFKVTIVDDGSTDNSLNIVTKEYGSNLLIEVINQPNSGKASALNNAIGGSLSEIIICIDADTLVKPDIIKRLLPYFNDEEVAAVSGYVKVGNRNNLITEMQYVEYITNQNFERAVFETINGILVVPGAIGAFRRSVLLEIGGYGVETITEDNDITLKILNSNYKIKNAAEVKGFTEAPSNIRMFFKQRVRWKVGAIQVLVKHRKSFNYHPNKALLYLVVPFTWLFDIVLPIFTHLIDYILLYHLFFEEQLLEVLGYYTSFIVLDALACLAVLFQSKEYSSLPLILWQRFLLRHLMFFVYFHILINLITGDIFKWNKIQREGTAVVE